MALEFIAETQTKEWGKLEALHGQKTAEQILTDLCKWMDTYGSLATLRHGFKCYGRTLRVAFFKAAPRAEPRIGGTLREEPRRHHRQLHFSARNEKSLDVVLSVNGIPVATVELKNPLTGQRSRMRCASIGWIATRASQSLISSGGHSSTSPWTLNSVYDTRLAGTGQRIFCRSTKATMVAREIRQTRTAAITARLICGEEVLQRDSLLDMFGAVSPFAD